MGPRTSSRPRMCPFRILGCPRRRCASFETETIARRALTLLSSQPYVRVCVNRPSFKKGDETTHARVTHVQILPDEFDETISIYRDSVVPAAQPQKGFKGVLLLTDRNTGKGISITMWEAEADMTMGEASGYYQQQLAKFKGAFGAPPVREQYEVSVQA